MMWSRIADFILKHRIALIVFLLLVSAFMISVSKIDRAYDYAPTVPQSDADFIYLKAFKQKYGEDGNILAIGIKDSALYRLEQFRLFSVLADSVRTVRGVNQVLSLPRLQYLDKDSSNKVFRFRRVFEQVPRTQAELDSLLGFAKSLKFYSGQILNEQNGATVLLVSIDKKVLNSADRERLMAEVKAFCDVFEQESRIELRYAGLPWVRSIMSTQVVAELNLFLILSLAATAIVLFLFFRSFSIVFFTVLVIGIVIVWTLGTMSLLGYQMTILTGLLPPVLVVIGIPNCVYMITKFHQEYSKHLQKEIALKEVIKKIGIVSFMTNLTTAIGFMVLTIADIEMMQEFGLVASINIASTFVICIIAIPIIFSFLPPPKNRHLKHLESKLLLRVFKTLDKVVCLHRPATLAVVTVLTILAAYGVSRIEAISYMAGEMPASSQVRQDLAFFEENFKGVMPLEIVVNTKKKQGIRNINSLERIHQFQQSLDSIGISTPSLSMITFLKAARQAFYNHDTAFYDMPDKREFAFLTNYLKGEQSNSALSRSFIDSTGQEVRISLKIADIGSVKMDSLIQQVIQPKIERYLTSQANPFEVRVTGTVPIFIKGNYYLIDNLKKTILLAIVVISILISVLFRSSRMIIVTIIANLIPMLITAGIMGYFGIPLKPSTALIFSIAFGIAVDDAIHYLARYRHELTQQNGAIIPAVRIALRETGQGMVYTSVILFFGFIMFTGSDFGGTVALGLLTSITLILAMLTNLVLLPSLLILVDKSSGKKLSKIEWIEQYESFYIDHQNDSKVSQPERR